MKRIPLGASKLVVSQLGLGCINFGTTTAREASFAVMDRYIEAGGNLLDTSNNYAFWNPGSQGHDSERVIGEWLSSTGLRDRVVLATKLGALPVGSSQDFSSLQGLGYHTILRSVEESLGHLKTDYLDLLYLHVDDRTTPQEETLAALDHLVKSGVVREIGCSNFRTWRIERARQICQANGYKFFSAVQQRFSYLTPSGDSDFFPQVAADGELGDYLASHRDLTLVSHSPLLYGVYQRLVQSGAPEAIDLKFYDSPENREKIRFLKEELARLGTSNPVPWVLSWVAQQHGGTVVLTTTGSPDHLSETLAFLDPLHENNDAGTERSGTRRHRWKSSLWDMGLLEQCTGTPFRRRGIR